MQAVDKMKARGIIPKAAVYARFSSDNQRDESIDAQLRAIQKYCEQNEIVVVGEYIDRARSATTDDRPEFLRMIEDSGEGKFNLVIVHKLDRFARNRFDSSHYRRKLEKNGVVLVSVLENLDDSPESIMMESVLEGMAEYYSRNLAREVRKGMNENALKCQTNGGIAPFGFKINKETKKYEINEDEAPAVRFIFESIAEGMSYEQVIKELNRMGYKTHAGKDFGKNSLNSILTNEKYKGVYIFNRRPSKDAYGHVNSHANKYPDEIIRIEDGIPRIVSDELFESVTKIMKRRSDLNPIKKHKRTYLLTGKIVCGLCGHRYTGGTKHGGKDKLYEYISYSCCNKHNKTYDTCKNRDIRRDELEDFVIREILRVVLADERIPELVKKYRESYSERLSASNTEIAGMEANIKQLTTKIGNIVQVISKTGSEALLTELEALEKEKARIENELNDVKSRLNGELISEEELTAAYRKARELFLNGSPEEKRQLINLYLEKVVVYEQYVEVYVNTLPRFIYERIMTAAAETAVTADENKNSHNSEKVVRKIGRGDGT